MYVMVIKAITFPILVLPGQFVFLDMKSGIALFEGKHFDILPGEWTYSN